MFEGTVGKFAIGGKWGEGKTGVELTEAKTSSTADFIPPGLNSHEIERRSGAIDGNWVLGFFVGDFECSSGRLSVEPANALFCFEWIGAGRRDFRPIGLSGVGRFRLTGVDIRKTRCDGFKTALMMHFLGKKCNRFLGFSQRI